MYNKYINIYKRKNTHWLSEVGAVTYYLKQENSSTEKQNDC